MMDNNKFSKFTPSAKEELEKIINDYKESLIEKSFEIANDRDTAGREIGLRDLLEAQQSTTNKLETEKHSILKKVQSLSFISIIASVYAIGGIIIYLLINRKFSLENDLGLLIAFAGILMIILVLLYTQLISKRELAKIYGKNEQNKQNREDNDLVIRWQIIEQLAKELMTESDKMETTNNSVSFQIQFLSHKIAKDKTEFLKIRELLLIRNKILHENYRVRPSQRKEFLDFADELIQRLEIIKSQKVEEKGRLRIIKAVYTTNRNSLDATNELNLLINNNRLECIANNDIVGDPDVGTVKELIITYELDGTVYTNKYKEGDKVIIERQNKK